MKYGKALMTDIQRYAGQPCISSGSPFSLFPLTLMRETNIISGIVSHLLLRRWVPYTISSGGDQLLGPIIKGVINFWNQLLKQWSIFGTIIKEGINFWKQLSKRFKFWNYQRGWNYYKRRDQLFEPIIKEVINFLNQLSKRWSNFWNLLSKRWSTFGGIQLQR